MTNFNKSFPEKIAYLKGLLTQLLTLEHSYRHQLTLIHSQYKIPFLKYSAETTLTYHIFRWVESSCLIPYTGTATTTADVFAAIERGEAFPRQPGGYFPDAEWYTFDSAFPAYNEWLKEQWVKAALSQKE